ncbi:Uncharacterized protein TCM_039376 [Theobroma cacao]|uniref:Uncharacterized protein n=1 Tax=Theobroma cacao TaxID=3641 RepID=A0A061GQ54_THECC|nr:Uncharacterized protein TCM_039376 [Theobroma cacao]
MEMSDREKTLSKVEIALKQLSIEESRSFGDGKQVFNLMKVGIMRKKAKESRESNVNLKVKEIDYLVD